MATINAVVATRQEKFPSGTVEGVFRFSLSGNGLESSIDLVQPTAIFPEVPPGVYTISVTKMGFSAQATIEVPGDLFFDVPTTITVTLG